MDYMKDLEALCDLISEQIADLHHKVKNSGMTSGDLDTLDKLTHSLASVKKIMAFDGGEYSGNSYRDAYRGSYKRDRMGRYSGERGYSRNTLADKMRDLMMEAPDDRTRQEMQRMVEKLEG